MSLFSGITPLSSLTLECGKFIGMLLPGDLSWLMLSCRCCGLSGTCGRARDVFGVIGDWRLVGWSCLA
jgi:hypothetical protein